MRSVSKQSRPSASRTSASSSSREGGRSSSWTTTWPAVRSRSSAPPGSSRVTAIRGRTATSTNSASSRAPQVAACTVPDCTWDHRTSAGASASSPKVCCGTASQYCGGVSPLLRCGRQHTRQHLLVVRTLLVWDRRGQKTSQFVLCWLLLVEAPEQFKDTHGRALVGNQRDRVVHRDVARFHHAAVDA